MTVNSDRYTLHTGDCLQVLQGFADNSVDTVLTDPPYGLSFMGHGWDHGVPGVPYWEQCLRVAKPGAILMAFGGTRTWHRLAVAIEDAGWEVRDTIMWIHGQGFPKSHDISKGIDKQGGESIAWFIDYCLEIATERGITRKQLTALFPSKNGGQTGWLYNKASHNQSLTPKQFNALKDFLDLPFENLEEAKREVIGTKQAGLGSGKTYAFQDANSQADKMIDITLPATDSAKQWQGYGTQLKPAWEPIILAMKPLDGTYAENALKWGVGGLWIDGARIATNGEKVTINTWDDGSKPFGGGAGHEYTGRKEDGGRWPSNLVHDGSEEVVKLFPQSDGQQANVRGTETSRPSGDSGIYGERARVGFDARNDSGSAARFFYVAKASRLEREAGLWDAGEQDTTQRYGSIRERNNYQKQGQDRVRNPHPTVKPLALMRYLCRLTRMPTGGIVLDPFMGSGSTGAGALMEDRTFVGIDLNPAYVEIARNRIEFWKDKAHLLDEEGKLDTQAVRWDRDNVTGGQQALFGGSND